ncbi:hypothetical protein EVAR_67476_1 [Eumeta japonica]|uniref:Uncharacterized protein n=1 Tax=Eumeta variegata TaxID=151549 RepID=A0A4C1Z9U0_EUMVA|nr:hypothetical protein EVAR_67476_1 [Eumeta japonica]
MRCDSSRRRRARPAAPRPPAPMTILLFRLKGRGSIPHLFHVAPLQCRDLESSKSTECELEVTDDLCHRTPRADLTLPGRRMLRFESNQKLIVDWSAIGARTCYFPVRRQSVRRLCPLHAGPSHVKRSRQNNAVRLTNIGTIRKKKCLVYPTLVENTKNLKRHTLTRSQYLIFSSVTRHVKRTPVRPRARKQYFHSEKASVTHEYMKVKFITLSAGGAARVPGQPSGHLQFSFYRESEKKKKRKRKYPLPSSLLTHLLAATGPRTRALV